MVDRRDARGALPAWAPRYLREFEAFLRTRTDRDALAARERMIALLPPGISHRSADRLAQRVAGGAPIRPFPELDPPELEA